MKKVMTIPGTMNPVAAASVSSGMIMKSNTLQRMIPIKKKYLVRLFPLIIFLFTGGFLTAQTTNVKTVDKATAALGDQLNFTITPSNQGTDLLREVTVRDFVPAGTTFSAAGQGGSFQTFTSAAAIPGDNVVFGTPQSKIFAFIGGSTPNFYAYDLNSPGWSSMASAPGSITTGSALASDGNRYIYAFQGESRAFYRYDAVNNVWTDPDVADLPLTAAIPGDGSALVYLDGKIYAFIGGNSNTFWIYDITANSWAQGTNAPGNINAGGSLATDGTTIFGLAGGGTRSFYNYDPETLLWSSKATTDRNIGAGSGLVFAEDGFLYATTGGGDNRLYRYNPDPTVNSWTQGINGSAVSTGGDLATNGVNFYVTLGTSTNTFLNWPFTGSTTSLAGLPANVTSGGALTYLPYPSAVGTSQMGASPNVRMLGESFTITMTLTATQAVTGVTPTTLQIIGGTASVSGPSPASADLVANTPQNYTWTVTPNNNGEFKFIAGATSSAVTFSNATTNSILVSPEGQSTFVQWSLGSNDPGTTGITAAKKYFYAFQGNTTAFWAYNTANGNWNNPDNPTDPTQTIFKGGALCNDGSTYIYALTGNSTRIFTRYDVVTDTWNDAAVADLPGTTDKTVDLGGSLVYLNGYVYAFLGNGSRQFWRYSVAGNSWTQMTIAPAAVGTGGGLTTNDTNIYATRGAGKKSFWRYNVATNNWTTLTNAPANIGDGGCLVFANGAIYVLRGAGQKTFWRYNIGANNWTTLAPFLANVDDGGAIAFNGTYINALRGKSNGYYRYTINTNTWSALNTTPANVGYGGALTYLPSGAVTNSNATTNYKLVTGTTNIVLSMTVTSSSAVNGITPSAPTYTVTSGVTVALVSGPTLATPDNNISGTGDPVTYTWTYTLTPGSSIGQVVFTTTSNVPPSFTATAQANSVIVSPVLTWQSTINSSAPFPPLVVHNTAIVNDANGNIQNYASNITSTDVPCTLTSSVGSQTNILCYGANTGSITLSYSGNAGAVSFAWTGPGGYNGTANPATNLYAGAYTGTITDARGCVATSTTTLTQPAAPLTASLLSYLNVNCYGQSTGSITVAAQGGVPPYSYSLDNVDYSNTTGIFTGLPATDYTIYIKDGNSCGPVTLPVTLTQPAEALAFSSLTLT